MFHAQLQIVVKIVEAFFMWADLSTKVFPRLWDYLFGITILRSVSKFPSCDILQKKNLAEINLPLSYD